MDNKGVIAAAVILAVGIGLSNVNWSSRSGGFQMMAREGRSRPAGYSDGNGEELLSVERTPSGFVTS
jgi:hypothetical protein